MCHLTTIIPRGKIEGIDGLVTYEADNAEEMKRAFESAVDYYLLFCKEKEIKSRL